MSTAIRLSLFALFLLSSWFSHGAPINSSVSTLEKYTLNEVAGKQNLRTQTTGYSFTRFRPQEFIGNHIKPGDVVTFAFNNQPVNLVFDGTVFYKNDIAIHWLAHVANSPDHKAVFVIDKNSLFSDRPLAGQPPAFRMAGKIYMENTTLRIRPLDDDETHLIYVPKNGNKEKFIKIKSNSMETRNRFLEAKVEHFEFLQTLPEGGFSVGISGAMVSLDRFPTEYDLTISEKLDRHGVPEEVNQFFKSILNHYPILGSEKFHFASDDPYGQLNKYHFYQTINGLRIMDSTSHVMVHHGRNEIVGLYIALTPDYGYDIEPNLSEFDAIDKAHEFALSEYWHGGSREILATTKKRPELVYRIDWTSGERIPVLYWVISLDSTGTELPTIYVNAMDGTASDLSITFH